MCRIKTLLLILERVRRCSYVVRTSHWSQQCCRNITPHCCCAEHEHSCIQMFTRQREQLNTPIKKENKDDFMSVWLTVADPMSTSLAASSRDLQPRRDAGPRLWSRTSPGSRSSGSGGSVVGWSSPVWPAGKTWGLRRDAPEQDVHVSVYSQMEDLSSSLHLTNVSLSVTDLHAVKSLLFPSLSVVQRVFTYWVLSSVYGGQSRELPETGTNQYRDITGQSRC